MSAIQKLTEYFTKFPGIGPRQAGRFVYFLLYMPNQYREELARLIVNLKNEISLCEKCFRYYAHYASPEEKACAICRDKNRETSQLLIVEKDVDIDNIERSGVYQGTYFVLGGRVRVLEKEPEKKVRAKELENEVKKRLESKTMDEIILAFSVNPDGENTKQYTVQLISPLIEKHNVKLSTLGRGLSTGTELEYSDVDTLKNAFQNRK